MKANERSGLKHKKMGVVFKNLTVVGEGADATSIPTLWSPFESILERLNPVNWYELEWRIVVLILIVCI